MGLFDSLFGGSAKKAARQNQAMLGGLKTEGMGYIDAGKQESQGYLQGIGDLYSGMTGTAQGNLGYYKDALGLNGAEGNAAALERFQAGPGYEFTLNQGLDSLDRRAAARGQLNSGNTNIDTVNYATGLANNTWNDYLTRLGGYDQQQNQNMLTGMAGQAGSLGSLADLSQNAVGQKLNLSSEIVNGMMAANNQRASASAQGASNGFGLIGSLLGFL